MMLRSLTPCILCALPLLAGCTGKLVEGGTTGATGGTAGTATCADDGMGVAIPRRLVRLSYAQLANGVGASLGQTARDAVDATKIAPSSGSREFMPLFNEGTQISTAVLPHTIRIAQAAASAITAAPGCASGDEACAQGFLLDLATKLYRRPASAEEQASINQLYADLRAHGNGVDEAVGYAVQGILLAAPALYRTEFGSAGGPLEPYEIASQLSYFLSDAPPDAALLAAAASGKLASEDGVRSEIDRLLQTDAVRSNLKFAMLAYFQTANIWADVKDTGLYPEYTVGLKASMYTEQELFVNDVLWNGKLNDLMTSPRSFVNNVLAPIYGVAYPGPATDESDVFLPVELPADQRAGLLTRGVTLAMRSRPEDTSVVSRGLFVNATVLCATQPPEPPSEVLAEVDAQLADATTTQRQKAERRAMTHPCSGCHAAFDAYGLVLENYDAIGRFRSNYTSFPGQPAIDTSAKLPPVAGGADVANVFEFVDAVTQNGRFSHCVTANLMRYALADASLLPTEDCAVSRANDGFRSSDQSFASLIKEIAVSPTLSRRVEP